MMRGSRLTVSWLESSWSPPGWVGEKDNVFMCCQGGENGMPAAQLAVLGKHVRIWEQINLRTLSCLFLTARLKIAREEIMQHHGKNKMSLKRWLQAVSWPKPYLESQKITLSVSNKSPCWSGWNIWLNFYHLVLGRRTCFSWERPKIFLTALWHTECERLKSLKKPPGACGLSKWYVRALKKMKTLSRDGKDKLKRWTHVM